MSDGSSTSTGTSPASRRRVDRSARPSSASDAPMKLVLAGLLAGGHVLLEDVPGLGKTLTARSFAQALGLGFRRVQFTPDLLPADVTGSYVYDQRTAEFVFRPGRSSPACCSPTRSTARRPRRRPPCWRRCRSARSPSRARRSRWPRRSTCSPPPTPSSTRAPTRCPRPSSTASCCASRSATRPPSEEWDVLRRRIGPAPARSRCSTRSPTPPGCSRCSGRARR